jgi:hypothetical protein
VVAAPVIWIRRAGLYPASHNRFAHYQGLPARTRPSMVQWGREPNRCLHVDLWRTHCSRDYVLFVVPLVLLWPAELQRKHWYAMLCVAMLWPPLLFGIIFRRDRLSILFGEIRHNLGLFGWLELFALCSCGCYLLLIHWQHGRLKARSGATKIL